jgi:hypothetical protein
VARSGATTVFDIQLDVGPRTVQLVPVSKFQPPTTGGSDGDQLSASVQVAGRPRYDSAGSATASAQQATLTGAAFNANFSVKPVSQVWGAWLSGTPNCTMTPAGEAKLTGAGVVTSTSNVIGGLTQYQQYNVAVCGAAGFGAALSTPQQVITWGATGAPGGTLTYTVATDPSHPQANVDFYGITGGPSPTVGPAFTPTYFANGIGWSSTFQLDPNLTPDPIVKACLTFNAAYCTDTAALTPTTAPNVVLVTFPVAVCVALDALPAANVSNGVGTVTPDTVSVPGSVVYKVTWGTGYEMLASPERIYTICVPDPPDPPDPGGGDPPDDPTPGG